VAGRLTSGHPRPWGSVVATLESPEEPEQLLGLAFLDARGLGCYHNGEDNLARQLLDRIYADHRLAASAGIVGNKFTARVAATLTGPGKSTLIPSGEERDFLFPLSIDILSCSQDMKKQIRLLGINTLGEPAGGRKEGQKPEYSPRVWG